MNGVVTHTRQQILAALLATACAFGCENVINVELKDVEPRLVIEGIVSNRIDEIQFILTRTTDFYSFNDVERVSNAIIVVTDSLGHTDTLWETPNPGFYVNPSHFPLAQNRTYYATVEVDGERYTASTTMPELIRIDSLRTEYQEGGGIGTVKDEGYRLHVYFQDAPDRSDYARIRISGDSDFYLYDGRYSDGNTIDYDYFYTLFQPGYRIFAILYAMDREMYYYFLTLDEVWAGLDEEDFLDATPANPNTNWSGGALGYFGAFTVDARHIWAPSQIQ